MEKEFINVFTSVERLLNAIIERATQSVDTVVRYFKKKLGIILNCFCGCSYEFTN